MNTSNAFMDESEKLIIENARIIFRNFKGEQTQFNHEGDRNFCVIIDDPDQANKLKEYGYNIKIRKPRTEDDEVTHYLKVNVSYRYKAPNVLLHSGNTVTQLGEDEIDILDNSDIVTCDMIISPSHWDRNGDRGVSAYLDTLHVVIRPDYFAGKYENN